MKPFFRSLPLVATVWPVQAHPGHDGHEFTWEIGHLGAHPVATIGWLAIFVAAGWLGRRWWKAFADRRRSELVGRGRVK